MWHLFFCGASLVAVCISRNELASAIGGSVLLMALAVGANSDSRKPAEMLNLWIHEKARADALDGVWDQKKIDVLKSSVLWSLNQAENHCDETEEWRRSSIWWRVVHRIFQLPMRPKTFRSKSLCYKEALLACIEDQIQKKQWPKQRVIDWQLAASITRQDEIEQRLLGDIYVLSEKAITLKVLITKVITPSVCFPKIAHIFTRLNVT
jgi:hypothetical protein